MKKLMIAAIAISMVCSVFAAEAVSTNFVYKTAAELKSMSKAEQDAYRAAVKEQALMRHGGMIRDTRAQHGRIIFANMQEVVDVGKLRSALTYVTDCTRLAVSVEDVAAVKLDDINGLHKSAKAEVIIAIGDFGDNPLMLVSPDENWAAVNVKKLGTKNQDARLQKEALRAFAHVTGAWTSTFKNPMTNPIADVRSLDGIKEIELPIDVLNRSIKYLGLLGVSPYEECRYSTAVKEGWAPAPTNKYQQAVWDRIHTIPTEPIKIKP